MHAITFPPDFAGWQLAARRALQAGLAPGEIAWQEGGSDQPLLEIGWEAGTAGAKVSRAKVPKSFVELAECVACHSAPGRWGVLYRVLWRIARGERALMQIVVDPDVHQLRRWEKAVRHDVHKMRAFVRFRAVEHGGETWYVAWFEPAHHIVKLNAPFFTDRFASMRWSILTPDRCAHWDGAKLSFTAGVTRADAPTEDATEGLWIKYYSHIFNPARVKVQAMESSMPRKYWKNLPEAAVIPALLREAPGRVEAMIAQSRAKKPEALPAKSA